MTRFGCLKALLILTGVFALGSPSAYANADMLPKVKVAFVFNVARFVTWHDPTDALNVCVFADETTTALFKSLQDRTVDESGTRLEIISGGLPGPHCHIVYASAELPEKKALGFTDSMNSTLFISDNMDAKDNGYHILVFPEGSRLRFKIDRAQVEDSRLTISSKLWRLAR